MNQMFNGMRRGVCNRPGFPASEGSNSHGFGALMIDRLVLRRRMMEFV